jgi:6-pyruvoyltetrahydropterin/6-carboxytetrahydropterin synthase
MPYRICRTFEIESGHMLSKHPDKCRFPHGHTRKVEFVLEAEKLDENEMVCDFKVLKEAMSEFLAKWDHALAMNTKDPKFDTFKEAYGERIIAFEGRDPTTEVMARTLFEVCEQRLAEYSQRSEPLYRFAPGVRLRSVKLWETTSSWAEYFVE